MRIYLYLLIGMTGILLLSTCSPEDGSEISDADQLNTSQEGFRYIWHDGEHIRIAAPSRSKFAHMGETRFTPSEGVISSISDNFFKIEGVKTYFSETACNNEDSFYAYVATGFNSIGSVYLGVYLYESDGDFFRYIYFDQLDSNGNLLYFLIARNSDTDFDDDKVSFSAVFDKHSNCEEVYDTEHDFYYYECSDTIENYGEGTGVIVCN